MLSSAGALQGIRPVRTGSSAGALERIGTTRQHYRTTIAAAALDGPLQSNDNGLSGLGRKVPTVQFQPPFDVKPPPHLDLFQGLQWSKDQRAAKEAWEREGGGYEF